MRRLLPCFLIFTVLVLTLEGQSIWWDEGISLHLAGLPWREILANRADNIHPPLYFLLLKGWTTLTGLTPFTGRYLSALAATLLPAAVYRFMARRLGGRAGLASAFLVSIAPPFIIYGQEIRAYALLPLGTLALWSLVWPSGDQRARPIARGLLLGCVQAALLLTHYAGAIAVGTAGAAYLIRFLGLGRRESRRGVAHEWGVGLILTAVLLTPWIGCVARAGLTGMTRQAGLANAFATKAPGDYVAGLLGMFHTTGMPEALGSAMLIRSSSLLGFLLILGAVSMLVRSQGRSPASPVLLLWLVPFLSAPFLWTLSPQSHPRYLFPFVLGGWLVAAMVSIAPRVPALVRMGVLAAVLSASLLGLQAYFTDPVYARSDVRAVAAFLRQETDPGAIVVVPHTDWSLEQYDLGSVRAVMTYPDADWIRGSGAAAGALDEANAVYALDYGRGSLDPAGSLRAALTWAGALVERREFSGVLVEVYELGDAPSDYIPARRPPLCAGGSGLCLVGQAYHSQPISGAAMPVVLQWEMPATEHIYAVTLRLHDVSGAVVASLDDILVGRTGMPAGASPDHGAVTTYHVLPLPVGLLPEPYQLTLGVFDWEDPARPVSLHSQDGGTMSSDFLGEVVPLAAPWREVSLYGVPEPPDLPVVQVSPWLQLEGGRVDRSSAGVGERIFVSTRWRMTELADADMDALFVLRQAGGNLTSVPASVVVSSLGVGRPLLLGSALLVPPIAADGTAEVLVAIDGHELILGAVGLVSTAHRFDVPDVDHPVSARVGHAATLLGYDLSPGENVVAGSPFTLTLTWRAEAGAATRDLKVFTHLVGEDGAVVAQHDSVPVNWSRPTEGWVPGEILIDVHELVWQTTDVSGPGELRVGLYDPASGVRVLWEDGQDAIALSGAVSIRAGE